jgi:hypothetical protein
LSESFVQVGLQVKLWCILIYILFLEDQTMMCCTFQDKVQSLPLKKETQSNNRSWLIFEQDHLFLSYGSLNRFNDFSHWQFIQRNYCDMKHKLIVEINTKQLIVHIANTNDITVWIDF